MSGMNPAEFANIRQSEEHFWWYRGMRTILFRMLAPYLVNRRIQCALEAGCGTGYFSQLLQGEHRWPVVPLDYSIDGLHYARELGVHDPVQGDIRALPFATAFFNSGESQVLAQHVEKPLHWWSFDLTIESVDCELELHCLVTGFGGQ